MNAEINMKIFLRNIYKIWQSILIGDLLLIVEVLILWLRSRIVGHQIIANTIEITGVAHLEGAIILAQLLHLGQVMHLVAYNIFTYGAVGTTRWPPVHGLKENQFARLL